MHLPKLLIVALVLPACLESPAVTQDHELGAMRSLEASARATSPSRADVEPEGEIDSGSAPAVEGVQDTHREDAAPGNQGAHEEVDLAFLEPTLGVLENLRRAERFTTLVAALELTGLEAVIAPGATPLMGWTLFAPTNEAFLAAGLVLDDFDTQPEVEALEEILWFHITWGASWGLDLNAPCSPYTQTLEMAQGAADQEGHGSPDVLTIENSCVGHVMAGGVPILAPDLKVKRGMIQVLGGVLLP